jgi:transcriptional regulator with XRE-family HTH domain
VSRGDLADKLRLHDADLAAIEAGAPISASMLYKIASALDVLIDQLKPVTAAP